MGKISYNSIVVDKVFAETLKTNDGVKYLDEDESIAKYGSGETILPYDWSPDYSNAFQEFGVSGYTAQTSGWLSVDSAERDVTSIFINDNITNTFYNDGSYQVFLTRGDSVTASSKIDITFVPTVSESAELPVPLTEYDIWCEIPFVSDDGVMLLKNKFIPNASFWNSKIYKPNNLTITKVENNKAYNVDSFVCNIQSEKIENGSRLFFNCRELVTFNSDLSSLSNGHLMFFNCNLDAISVEKILTTIPTYTSGVHELTMTIQDSAVSKFSEIVGVEITNRISVVEYKGWTITLLRKDEREMPTDYDIWKNVVTVTNDMQIIISNLYIPDASKWNSAIYQKNNLNITLVENDKAYNGNNFVCNIQSGNIENGSDLFKNSYELTSFSNSLSQLKNGNRMFLNSGLTDFTVELSSLTDAKNMFVGCPLGATSIETILNSLPTYTSGSHEIGLTLMTETEANKFSEITGATIEQRQIYSISYKGWNIKTYLSKDDRETQTNYDIWENVIVYDSNTDEIGFVDLYLPDASVWREEIYNANRLRITSVEDNKAYNNSKFVCNIKTDKIVNGDGLFDGVSSLVTFTSPLSSLSSGDNMFNECNLDIASVENILGSIPTYTSGQHVLTMMIASDSVEKFKEITGCGEIGEEMVSVSYKGWTINVSIVARMSTDFDIWEGTPYIPDASNWRANVYNKNNIRITDVKDNKMFNGDEFVANIQCENIETDATLNLENQTYIPSLFSNTHLKSFEGDLSSLKIPLATFANTNITNFDSDLSNVTFAPFGLFGGCFDLTEFNSDLPNLVMSEMGYITSMMFEEGETSEKSPLFPSLVSFINTGLTSFDGDLSSLVCSNMFVYCDKLENFLSDISSLGDFSKLYEHPEIIDWFKTMGMFPADYVLPSIDLWGFVENYLFAFNFMFIGCNLNSTSVEHILNSLTSYDDGYLRMLGMTINSSAVPTFTQITGATFGGNFCEVSFKGWTIYCEIREEFVPTEMDVLEGSPNCDELAIIANQDYSALQNSLSYSLVQLSDLKPVGYKVKLNNNKVYVNYNDSDTFAFNVQCDKLVTSLGAICFFDEIFLSDFPKLKYNMNYFGSMGTSGGFISSFSGDLRSLTFDQGGFAATPLNLFYTSLHSLVCSLATFTECVNLQEFHSDLRSLCCGEGMFDGCSNLTSFNAGLFSLGDVEKFVDAMYEFYLYILSEGEEPPTKEEVMQDFGEVTFGGGMFTGCKLDAASVENILTTIPAYDDGIYRELGMTIQSGEAAAKFGEITGIIPASTEEVEVPFKGWNVKVNLFSV